MKRRALIRLISFLLGIILLLSACQGGTPEDAASDTTETLPEESVPDEQTKAGDNETNIFDSTLFEGKLACYFFKSGSNWSAAEEGEHGGDSMLFILPDGTTCMIDCNLPNNGAYIAYGLQQLGIKKIDYFINSHPHIDHMGGFSIIARYVDIGEVIMPDVPIKEEGMNTPYYRKMMDIIEERGIKVTKLLEGATIQMGELTGKVFNPIEGFDPNTANYNEGSLVIRFAWKGASFLFGGDAGNNEKLGQKTETIIVEKYGDELKSDIAKLNHHGEPSTQSQSAGWLDHVNAKLYVGCLSNVPNDVEYYRLLTEMTKRGATLMHTGLDGTILVTTDGSGSYDVYAGKARTTDYYGTLDMDENNCVHID